MNKLNSVAAIATIVGSIFTVAAFYYHNEMPYPGESVKDVLSPDNSRHEPFLSKDENIPNINNEVNPEEPAEVSDSHIASREEILARYAVAKDIPYMSDRSDVLLGLVRLASKSGLYEEAIKIARNIPYTGTRSEALVVIVKAAYEVSPNLALDAAKLIPYTSTRSKMLKYIATK